MPWNDFRDYEVVVVRDRSNGTFLKVFSRRDDFNRRYQVDVNSINMECIRWELNKRESTLILHVPKKGPDSPHRCCAESTRHRQCGRGRLATLEANTPSATPEPDAQYLESEAETPSGSESESDLETETWSTDEVKSKVAEEKWASSSENEATETGERASDSGADPTAIESDDALTRLSFIPTIEEVEDEEFTFLRKQSGL